MMAGLRRVGKRWWVGGCERVDRLVGMIGDMEELKDSPAVPLDPM